MNKHQGASYAHSDANLSKYYILTRPAKLSDLSFDEMEDEGGWREKSKHLQARRWRKIRHQLA